jgi:choline-sulfatase
MPVTHSRWFRSSAMMCAVVFILGCGGPAPLTVDMPLHLEDHLDAATIVGSEVPAEILAPVEWRFDEPQPEWKPLVPRETSIKPVQMARTEDVLRLTLTDANRLPGRSDGSVWGSIYVDLPDYRLADWGAILVRARTSDQVRDLSVAFNLRETLLSGDDPVFLAHASDHGAPVINDGSVNTYAFRADRLDTYPESNWQRAGSRDWGHPWQQLGIRLYAREPVSFDLLSVTIIPTEAAYAHAPVGVRTEIQSKTHRRTLYTHAPGRLEYRVRVPEAGRLDVGLGLLREDAPVSFRITARPEGGEADTLFEESYTDHRRWAQRSVDLSHLAGRIATLALEADAERAGTVALWAAPTLTGARGTEKPNIIFYVIDGGGADHMSVYGYNRRTTPNLERLADEGALFEHAYSNSTHTSVSTPSFVTSLHSSVLRGDGDARMIPEQEVSMAEHLHPAGYQTALFTSNPHAGWYAGLERGFDVLRDAAFSKDSASSVQLHEDYWRWREAYPGEPYWVHFQTTDVHWGFGPVPPFAGLYVSPELGERYSEWERQIEEARGRTSARIPDSVVYAEAGIDPVAHVHARGGLYDEAMAHQDYQLGRLVQRLKEAGEWEHTLLIVAADHSHWAAGLRDPSLTDYDPMFRSSVTRIPMLIVWPGRIAGGQRFSQPVSMIDMLPTILDLAGLPMPEVVQGQSLAPLLLGEEGWEPRPVILDEFEVDPETSELTGVIEVIDGRWGASLLIKPRPGAWPESQRAAPLLLYDLWNDPYTQHSLHEERPDLVEKYTEFLEAQFEAHQSLAQLFTRSDPVALTPEQLRTLRALGYIQ